jgi:hypothetical protein
VEQTNRQTYTQKHIHAHNVYIEEKKKEEEEMKRRRRIRKENTG